MCWLALYSRIPSSRSMKFSSGGCRLASRRAVHLRALHSNSLLGDVLVRESVKFYFYCHCPERSTYVSCFLELYFSFLVSHQYCKTVAPLCVNGQASCKCFNRLSSILCPMLQRVNMLLACEQGETGVS